MLTLAKISKSFGGRILYEDVSLSINAGERLAIVGPNGAGKSTLFNIILGNMDPDEGGVVLDPGVTLGYLPQETSIATDETILELATAITPELGRLRRLLSDGEKSGEIDTEEYHEAQAQFAELGGFQLEPKAKRILHGLAFRETDFHRPARNMSGGWVMRAHLARLLVQEPDLLMLDEPTNHLDLESLSWFQNYLLYYPGAILMISHDRAFLNALVESVLEVRAPRINKYRGNYDDYLVERAAREAQQWAAYKNQQAEIDRLQTFADRFRAKASKASQAQSKLKQIDRMEKIEAPESATKKIHIKFPQPLRSGQRVITLKDVSHAYGDLVVYKKLEIEVERDSRMVLVGPNGAGKSTLLKLLGGVLPIQNGERLEGHNTHVGYYSQNRIDMLGANRTVLEEVMSIPKPMPEVQARTVLGSFLFSGDDSYKKVSVLSGGEKSRLALIKLLLDPPNLLLMDEPTTHLDMNSIDALIEALKQYHGSLVFISHDVYFIKALAKSVLHINAGKLTPYSGDYDYYLEKSGATSERAALVAGDRLTDSRPAEALVRKNSVNNGANGSAVKTKEQKRQEAEQRQALSDAKKKAKNKLEQIERFIAQKEARQKELTTKLEDPAVYQKGGEVMQINRELDEVTSELERLNSSWEQASTEMEKFEATVAAGAES